ncbi:MAG: pilus assembly protein PilP [Acidovorax sp.]|nr:pilus assembly protein PilP [Acidovorax sp.]
MQWWPMGWLALALAGCSDAPERDLQAWVLAQRAAVQPQRMALQSPGVFHPQTYPAASLADPFDQGRLQPGAAWGEHQAVLAAPEGGRDPQVLEQFPLDAMTMVGSLERQGRRTALLRVDQLLYQVQVGQYLGPHQGRVTQILEDRIALRELIPDEAGAWVERNTTLDLQQGGR